MQQQPYLFYSKASFDDRPRDADLCGKRAVLLVSVGQDYHEGDKLAATVELLNRCELAHCTIAVADTLQRHNEPEPDPARAQCLAHAAGTHWLRRNDAILGALRPNCEVLRWDDARADAAYPGWCRAVRRAHAESAPYRAALQQTVDAFVQRAAKRCPDVDCGELAGKCLSYLLEECPIIMPLWASQGCDYVVYPQPMTAAMRATRELFVRERYPGKARWLSLRFKRRAQASRLPVPAALAAQLPATPGEPPP
ncbi:MAG: hypothetical protein JO224_06420 [Pelomonas sp.]|nr:hypothetical protein [Roseateles sp.]